LRSTDCGTTASWRAHQKGGRLCVLNWMPATTASVRLLLWVHVIACLCFLLGWHFRIAAVLVFVSLTSLHHRNTFILSSGDTLLRVFSFLAIFSSADAACSVDAWRLGENDFPDVDPWPLRLMQLQISVVYLRTVYWKLRGTTWWNGTAAWYPVWVETYLRNRPSRWLLRTPFLQLATWGTLVAELALGLLIWIRELRPAVIVAGLLMHGVFEVVLNLQLFGWIMSVGLLLFVSPASAESWLAWLL
jgi:hypothetical protein